MPVSIPDAAEHERPCRERDGVPGLARHGVPDDDHLEDGEHDPRRVADEEDEHDAHEHDGQVVLLAAARLLRGRGRRRRLPRQRHLAAVAVLHVLVDLENTKTELEMVELCLFASKSQEVERAKKIEPGFRDGESI